MAWWSGGDCVSSDCIEAAYYNSILDKGEVAWNCVFGGSTGGPFTSTPRAVAGTTTVQASDVNDIRGYIETMTASCSDCVWSELTAPCPDSTDVTAGVDVVCMCDFFCLEAALDCIIANCCGSSSCADCLEECSGGDMTVVISGISCSSDFNCDAYAASLNGTFVVPWIGGCNWGFVNETGSVHIQIQCLSDTWYIWVEGQYYNHLSYGKTGAVLNCTGDHPTGTVTLDNQAGYQCYDYCSATCTITIS